MREACRHCATPIPPELSGTGFCCSGCKQVYALLHEEGLARYYEIAQGQTAPVPEAVHSRNLVWLEPLLSAAQSRDSCSLELDVQGIHCAACVWLMNELWRRGGGGPGLVVNPALGKVLMSWSRGSIDVPGFVAEVERFGYLFGPSRKTSDRASRDLLGRLGVSAALAMNIMMFSAAFYTGLAPRDGLPFQLFSLLAIGLTAVTVAVGGWPFFRSAIHALRRGILHLDLPIALGIALAFAASLWQARQNRADVGYFDTVAIFVTLMLAGRWLQQRVLDRNRRYLLEDDGAAGILVRRLEGGALALVPAPTIESGDELFLAPGDLAPVDAELLSGPASFSTDWISGEAEPHDVSQGGTVAAGSFLSGTASARLRALTGFADSPLPLLLRSGSSAGSQHQRFWDRLARVYVVGVLLLAASGLLLWWPRSPGRAMEVTVALLVVTCPCALGIAIPLAYELALSSLRRSGFFARSPDLLDRLLRVRKVIFDKTGTLTLGRQGLVDARALADLDPEVRDAAFDMAARSSHPVSRCLAAELRAMGARFDPDALVTERAGQGMELTRGGHSYALGRSAQGTAISVDGQVALPIEIRDQIRADARRELRELQGRGLSIHLLSGDDRGKVAAISADLGIPAAHAEGQLSPQAKADRVAALDAEDTLYLGDGINDSLAFERAFCAGTPAIDRPVLPGKADFFLVGEGIGGLRTGLQLAQRLRVTVRRIMALAFTYNAVAVVSCLLGVMTPVRAAVAMPISSLAILLFTATSMRSASSARDMHGATDAGAKEALA